MAEETKTKTNTSETLKDVPPHIAQQIKDDLEKAKKKFSEEKLVKVKIPKSLQSKIGQTWFCSVNGVRVVLPVNGEENEVPETFANHWQEYLANLTV